MTLLEYIKKTIILFFAISSIKVIIKTNLYRYNTIKKLPIVCLVYFFSSFFYIQASTIASTEIIEPTKEQTNEDEAPPKKDESLQCNFKSPQITFNPQTIFDENEDGILFLHRWANALHINTKTFTLENESSFFIKKCQKTPADLDELERHLRSRKYLRDASVKGNEEAITVTTWDNWSLLPTLAFGRKGGVNTYSIGIKDRNLLGLGLDTEFASYQNSQRSGYKLKVIAPLYQKRNMSANLTLSDNDDGQQYSLFIDKSFAGFHTKNAYDIGFNEESRNDTIFQNNQDQSKYQHDISFKRISYAWLDFNTGKRLLRYRLGFTQDKDTFSSLPIDELEITETPNDDINTETPPYLTDQLPYDRNFVYPWFTLEYLEKDFRKLSNVRLITQIEDFNHGWQVNSGLGLGNGNKDNAAWALWNLHVKKGFNLHNNALFLLDFTLANDIYKHRDNRLLLSLSGEYFYQFTPKWGFYLGNFNVVSKNQYLDQPVTMGGDTGLRGFPLQYQHGQNSVKVTSEIRYYPNINMFKLFDIAGAAFIDAGRAFEASTVENIEKGWLGSFGLGLRFHSPHSAGDSPIVHVDFAFPQSENPDINSFEVRVQAKKSF